MAANPAHEMRFSGAILAGGASTRMGTDKAFVDLGEHQLIEVAADALGGAGASEVFVVGGDADALGSLGLRYVADQFPGQGPLGGVISALSAATTEVVAILACDHISTTPEAVLSVLGALGRADVAVPIVGEHHQSTHAVWRHSAHGILTEAFETGARSIRAGMERLVVAEVPNLNPAWFADADTPGDLPPGVRAL